MSLKKLTESAEDYRGQFDHKLRIVSIPNLKAMCEHLSGTCHRFFLDSVKGKYARVMYNNPDEYGHKSPIVALFQVIEHCGTIGAILTIDKVVNCPNDCEDWRAFEQLLECPTVWRLGAGAKEWRTQVQRQEELLRSTT